MFIAPKSFLAHVSYLVLVASVDASRPSTVLVVVDDLIRSASARIQYNPNSWI